MNIRNARTLAALLAVLICGLAAAGCRPTPEGAVSTPEEQPEEQPGPSVRQAEAGDPEAQPPAAEDVVDERPGLVIDREARQVTVPARTTKVRGQDPVEFILILEASGKDYEALAETHVKPSAVHRALEEIGLEAGQPVDTHQARFWPRGARVRILVEWEDAEGILRQERVGTLLQDRRTGTPLPDAGFLFTGSRRVTWDEGMEPVYAADHHEPMSIISTYNDPETVIDLPYQAGQGEQYGHITVSPDILIPMEREIRFIFEPWPEPRARPDVDIHIEVGQTPDTGEGIAAIQVTVSEEDGDPRSMGAAELMKRFGELAEAGRWPYVHVRFADDLEVPLAAAFCRLLRAVESPRGIRVDGRQDGHLFYRAFAPDPVLYDREERGQQPPELHLRREGGALIAAVHKTVQEWDEELFRFGAPKVTEHPLESIEDLGGALEELGLAPPVLLVFTDAEVTYGEIMRAVRPVMERYSIIYVLPPRTD